MRPLVSEPEPGTLLFHWNAPQSRFKTLKAQPYGPIQYIDYEGAVRAGKTTAPSSKACEYAEEWPGIHLGIARWKDNDLFGQVAPAWRAMAKRYGLRLKWNTDEQYDEVLNTEGPDGENSRVYLRALHTNELDSRYSKLAGLTLSVLWIDQPEEVPQDVIDAYVPARLSQPGYPHELWLTPNPVDETDHWIAKWFPADPSLLKPNHHYIHTSLYDNVAGVGEQYIKDMEDKYQPGHALRRRFIEGRRGLSVVGDPVYAGAFSRTLHVSDDAAFNPHMPLLEAWDFGHHHPAVLWSQFVHGTWLVLGEVQGSDMFIEDFAPWVLQQRAAFFPGMTETWSCCDPAGTMKNSQGTKTSACDVLNAHGVFPRAIDGSNSPTMRDSAIQKLGAALQRLTHGRPAVRVHPRCRQFIDGLEAGYVWDSRSIANSISPNTRRPRKDGTYDHLQNCGEYTWLNFGPAYLTPDATKQGEAQAERRANRGRMDYDRLDKQLGRGVYRTRGGNTMSRGGA